MSRQTDEWYEQQAREFKKALRDYCENKEVVHVFELGSKYGINFSLLFFAGETLVVNRIAERIAASYGVKLRP